MRTESLRSPVRFKADRLLFMAELFGRLDGAKGSRATGSSSAVKYPGEARSDYNQNLDRKAMPRGRSSSTELGAVHSYEWLSQRVACLPG